MSRPRLPRPSCSRTRARRSTACWTSCVRTSSSASVSDDGVATLELGTGAELRLATLPSQPKESLVDRSADGSRLVSEPLVQVREATTYRFQIQTHQAVPLRIEPSELFDCDDLSGRAGRFRPGEAVGFLEITVFADGALVGR